jgi:DNA-binding CsgD family transcriptional regulator
MSHPSRRADADPFTDREIQILALVAAGDTIPAIARRLGVAPNTVKSHLTSVYRKTGVTNRVEVTRYFLDHYTSHPSAHGSPQPAQRPALLSPIQQQVHEIHLRLDQVDDASDEAQPLRHALHALLALSARPIRHRQT